VCLCDEASQERIRAVKESLQSCKNLLHCKRDELRRLWIEGVEMKTVYASLDAVEQVKDVAEQIPALIAGRKYLTATELVISSLAVLDTELTDVDALQQVSRDLCMCICLLVITVTTTTLLHLFNGLFSGTTWVSCYQKGTASVDVNEARDDGVLGCNGISWTICKQSASCSRQITRPAPHHSIFYRPDALPDAQPTVSKH